MMGSILPVRIVPQTIRQKASAKPKERRATSPAKALEMKTILAKALPCQICSNIMGVAPVQEESLVHHRSRSNLFQDANTQHTIRRCFDCSPLQNSVFGRAQACPLSTQAKFRECKK